MRLLVHGRLKLLFNGLSGALNETLELVKGCRTAVASPLVNGLAVVVEIRVRVSRFLRGNASVTQDASSRVCIHALITEIARI